MVIMERVVVQINPDVERGCEKISIFAIDDTPHLY